MKYTLELWCLVHLIYVSSCDAKTGARERKTGKRDDTSVNSAKDHTQPRIDTTTSMPKFNVVLKDIPLGSSNFSQIRHSRSFVDKTLWIKDFWERSAQYLYITAPPRFGKTILMNTGMEFFNAVEDIYKLQNRSNSFSVKESFKGTKLYEEERGFFDTHYHKYIVMYFDFRSLASVHNLNEFERVFCGIICDMWDSLHPEGDRTAANSDGLHQCENNCKKDFIGQCMELGQRFPKVLHTAYGKPVLVFIDEFDAFVYAALNNVGLQPYLGPISSRLANYLSLLIKGNPFVQRFYATGSLFLGGAISQLATNIDHVMFCSDEHYAQYFGLTEREVQRLLGNFSLSHLLPQVREFYDGYQIQNSDQNIYNTISILRFLKSGGELDYYWAYAVQPLSDYSDIFSHPLIGEKIATVMIGGSIVLQPNSRTTLSHLQKLKQNLLQETLEARIFINYLEEAGYLTRSRQNPFELKATNEETRFALEHVLVRESTYFQTQRNISREHKRNLVNAVASLSVIASLSEDDSANAVRRLAKALHEMYSADCPSVTDEKVTFVGPIYSALRSEMADEYNQIFTLVSAEEKVNLAGLNVETNRKYGKVDVTILFADGGASLWKCKWNKTATEGMDQMFDKKYLALFDQKFADKITKPKSFLAINIDCKCRITIKYKIGSPNKEGAKEVACPE